jgi:lipid II:glycine glycyltransferase (peptidoglycan interpeptide bridge formation enzyme)
VDPASPALDLLIDFARNEARRRGAFLVRIEPNVTQDDTQWPSVLRRLGFRPTSHFIYRRGAWVTDLRPDEGRILAGMQASWRRYIRAGAKHRLVIREGGSDADIAAFYDLLVETGKRDRFYVYPSAIYRDMLFNYSPLAAVVFSTAEMALFLVEHDGVVVAAATVAVLGDWAWYLHGASSALSEHRTLRPNHPLQWACMRWAKARGAQFYDWRTIPDILRPGKELYGVYQFKRGFGGFERRVLPTHDLVLRPELYWPWIAAVGVSKRWRHTSRRARERRDERARERALLADHSVNRLYVVVPNPMSDDPLPWRW